MMHEFFIFQTYGNDGNHSGDFGIDERTVIKQTLTFRRLTSTIVDVPHR